MLAAGGGLLEELFAAGAEGLAKAFEGGGAPGDEGGGGGGGEEEEVEGAGVDDVDGFEAGGEA